jgi:hypothetical protein
MEIKMLKCGQKNNKNYTFGVRKEQINEAEKENQICCLKCGICFFHKMKYCSNCGEKMK